MKTVYLIGITLIACAGIAFTPVTVPVAGPCGVISLGTVKLDLSRSEIHGQIQKDALVKNFKQGFSFTGSSECPGTYEIVGLSLTINGARDARYNYDYAMVSQMKEMDDFMLVRYFNDAQSMKISDIRVKNSKGEVIEIPSVSLDVK